MRIHTIRCNQCSKEKQQDISLPGITPVDWYTLNKGSYSVTPEVHLCSYKCLKEWVLSRETINPNPIGGPASADIGTVTDRAPKAYEIVQQERERV
jgi:hypothetical protein